jgi:steroid 5-alpha reductase family enzyme
MLYAAITTFIFFFLFFVVATIIKNNSIVDIGWGFGFVLTSWVVFFIYGNYSLTSIIVNIMVSLWGLRLFYHILKRNVGEEEDFRYKAWRKAWGKYVIPRAFIQVFMLQGLFQFMIGSVSYYLNANNLSFNIISIIGVIIWLIGYYYQVIGDKQLKNFIKNKNKDEPLLKTGLWKQTRHPNYFGESIMWIGIFIFGAINGVPLYYVISPLTIFLVLYFISTPLLEEKMKEKPGWDEYAKETPMFFPVKFK